MGAPSTDRSGVQRTWQALTDAGYSIVVQDGAGEEFKGLDKSSAVNEVMSCDDGYFLVFAEGESQRVGWVWFVFGNSPEEVICDYTISLEHVIEPLTADWF